MTRYDDLKMANGLPHPLAGWHQDSLDAAAKELKAAFVWAKLDAAALDMDLEAIAESVLLSAIAAERVERTHKMAAPCQRCGWHEGDAWSTDHWLWNLIVGGDAEKPASGMICASCFITMAQEHFERGRFRVEMLPETVIPGPVRESSEGPEAGHRWRFTVDSCLAAGIKGPDDAEAHSFRDADWWSRARRIEVRAQSLHDAIVKLADVPFVDWMHSEYDDRELEEADDQG